MDVSTVRLEFSNNVRVYPRTCLSRTQTSNLVQQEILHGETAGIMVMFAPRSGICTYGSSSLPFDYFCDFENADAIIWSEHGRLVRAPSSFTADRPLLRCATDESLFMLSKKPEMPIAMQCGRLRGTIRDNISLHQMITLDKRDDIVACVHARDPQWLLCLARIFLCSNARWQQQHQHQQQRWVYDFCSNTSAVVVLLQRAHANVIHARGQRQRRHSTRQNTLGWRIFHTATLERIAATSMDSSFPVTDSSRWHLCESVADCERQLGRV